MAGWYVFSLYKSPMTRIAELPACLVVMTCIVAANQPNMGPDRPPTPWLGCVASGPTTHSGPHKFMHHASKIYVYVYTHIFFTFVQNWWVLTTIFGFWNVADKKEAGLLEEETDRRMIEIWQKHTEPISTRYLLIKT